ncbi:ABC transporter substrate-binding protein [Endozoicomonas sp.]|uniref:ABC transporter substrate-binding protein n=1 Tax=Endozoicomonas sp. TaxID=1892382 RepID=UPI002887B3AA|nr:ABC transporter substrate-binding protein [Endozoicomonas sp.]
MTPACWVADKLAFKNANIVDYHCWPDNVDRLAPPLFQRKLLAMVGADCSSPATRIATIANDYQTPVISYGANSDNLSNNRLFPWFLRTVTPGSRYDTYLIDIAVHYGKQKVALLYTTDDWGLGAKASIQSRAEEYGMTLEAAIGYPRNTSVSNVQKLLIEKLADNVDAVLIVMPTPDTVTTFKALGELGLNRSNRMMLAGEMFSADESPAVVRHAQGYMAPIARLPDTPELSGFRRSFSEYMGVTPELHSKAFIYAALS